MIHAMYDLAAILCDVISTWLKHDLGAADYRIVRLAFFSTIAASVAFALTRTWVNVIIGIARLVIIRVPQSMFRLFCQAGRETEKALGGFIQQAREWLAARKRQHHGL